MIFSSSSNNFSLHAAMNVTRFSRALKHGRANARLTIFLLLFLFFFLFVEIACRSLRSHDGSRLSRQWPWESAWANRGAEHFSPHSSIIHLRPSPRTFSSSIPPSTFAPTRDPCSFIRIPGVSSRGIRRRDTGLRRSVRARGIFEIRHVLPYRI